MNVKWNRVFGALTAGIVIAGGIIVWMNAYQDQDVPRCTDSIADSGGICQGEPIPDSLPPCPTEDSTNCYWDAQTMGNGKGDDVVTIEPTPATTIPTPVQNSEMAVIYSENDMVIWEDGTWHDSVTGYDGCTEGYPCDTSGKYEIVPEYPAGWPDNGRYCWENLMEQVVCLKAGVTP